MADEAEDMLDEPVILPEADNIVAMDCEMVGVGERKQNVLARCSIVDYYGNVVYDQYVKPSAPITDYRWRWSGILPVHMRRAIPFNVARKQILRILQSKIIVGHSVHCDFKILKYRRASSHVRDTAKCVDLKAKAGFPLNQTPSLKRLSSAVLGRDIQSDTHCSVEDATASMDLYRTVEDKWESDLRKRKCGGGNGDNFLHDIIIIIIIIIIIMILFGPHG